MIEKFNKFLIKTDIPPKHPDLDTFDKCYSVISEQDDMLEYQSIHLFSCYKYIYEALLYESAWKDAISKLDTDKPEQFLVPNTDILIPGGPQGYGPN